MNHSYTTSAHQFCCQMEGSSGSPLVFFFLWFLLSTTGLASTMTGMTALSLLRVCSCCFVLVADFFTRIGTIAATDTVASSSGPSVSCGVNKLVLMAYSLIGTGKTTRESARRPNGLPSSTRNCVRAAHAKCNSNKKWFPGVPELVPQMVDHLW